jgi:hypothetical protein
MKTFDALDEDHKRSAIRLAAMIPDMVEASLLVPYHSIGIVVVHNEIRRLINKIIRQELAKWGALEEYSPWTIRAKNDCTFHVSPISGVAYRGRSINKLYLPPMDILDTKRLNEMNYFLYGFMPVIMSCRDCEIVYNY